MLNPNGTFTYTPPADFFGVITFKYQVRDLTGLTSAITDFVITVVDVAEKPQPGQNGTGANDPSTPTDAAPPDDVSRTVGLSNNVAAENSVSGTIVGALSALDLDWRESLSFQLLDNAGGRFTLMGSTLVVANGALLDYEQATSHTVAIRSIDQAGLSFDQILTITIEDVRNERVTGTIGNDKVSGGSGADKIKGGAGNDILAAGGGKDVVDGGEGHDRILGGASNDRLIGGKGRDVFAFGNKETGFSKKTADYIVDFSGKEKDRIDLRPIDADTKKKGNQAFKFVGEDGFTGAGQVRYEKGVKETLVYFSTDNDKLAEGIIRLNGTMDLHKGWFML
jgi:Ca2+-binding RTX toxin-like protein